MDEVTMHILECDGKPIAYRYGPEWKAMQLLLEGGYKTREEAIEAWEVESGVRSCGQNEGADR